MEPLFATEEDYEAFHRRQAAYKVSTGDLESYKGNCYLGIDAGSTTTKTALVGEDGKPSLLLLQQQQRKPVKDGDPVDPGDLFPPSQGRAYRLLLFYRLWRSVGESPLLWTMAKWKPFLIIMRPPFLIRRLTVSWISAARI